MQTKELTNHVQHNYEKTTSTTPEPRLSSVYRVFSAHMIRHNSLVYWPSEFAHQIPMKINSLARALGVDIDQRRSAAALAVVPP